MRLISLQSLNNHPKAREMKIGDEVYYAEMPYKIIRRIGSSYLIEPIHENPVFRRYTLIKKKDELTTQKQER